MPFEFEKSAGKRIAVIGGGISGMGAAHLLAGDHRVVLFESSDRLGGHARTVLAGRNGDQPVDTGFIVYNRVNYPHMVRLFEQLEVPVCESDMSFAASIDGGRIEYGLSDLSALFVQKRNMLRPGYLRMLRDVLKFNAQAVDASQDPRLTLGGLLDRLHLGPWFRDYYLAPLSGAIWSTPPDRMMDFPARAFVQFFQNHALLGLTGQHQWYTVRGGSIQYVTRLRAAMQARGVELRLGAPVAQVRRDAAGVEVTERDGSAEIFDEVVFATHSDDALALLADPGDAEARALGAIRYQSNEAVLHADASVMPQRRGCWSSWNYTEAAGPRAERIDLTYWMNSLQPIPKDDPLFVTLNSRRQIDPKLVYDTTTFRHPVFDLGALEGQASLRAINGQNRTWYCGAWMRNGFHEDGYASAIDVVRQLAELPVWA